MCYLCQKCAITKKTTMMVVYSYRWRFRLEPKECSSTNQPNSFERRVHKSRKDRSLTKVLNSASKRLRSLIYSRTWEYLPFWGSGGRISTTCVSCLDCSGCSGFMRTRRSSSTLTEEVLMFWMFTAPYTWMMMAPLQRPFRRCVKFSFFWSLLFDVD